jgi:hypothetical protein
MSLQISCPHCDTALWVPDDSPALWVVCPDCAGRIPHPDRPIESSENTPETIHGVVVEEDFRRRWSEAVTLQRVFLLSVLGELVVSTIAAPYLGAPLLVLPLWLAFAGSSCIVVACIQRTDHALLRVMAWTYLGSFAVVGTLVVVALILAPCFACFLGLLFILTHGER